MNVALIDDRIQDLIDAESFLKNYIAENFSEHADSVQLDTFSHAEIFLRDFEPKKYSLLILDIFMKPLNGIQVAEAVRKLDSEVAIVFLTNSPDFFLEGYKVFAVGYFLKPFAENAAQFDKTFKFVFQKLLASQKNLSVKLSGGLDVKIPFKRIKFIDIDWRHRVCIHLEGKKIYPSGSYDKISAEMLSDDNFVECYHRILLNMDFIKYMDDDNFILRDETKIPISQRKSKASKLKYMAHLMKGSEQ